MNVGKFPETVRPIVSGGGWRAEKPQRYKPMNDTKIKILFLEENPADYELNVDFHQFTEVVSQICLYWLQLNRQPECVPGGPLVENS